MSVLVTGGAGFIGSHTAVDLLARGYDVIIADNLSNSEFGVIERIQEISRKTVRFYKTDLRDRTGMDHIFQTHRDINSVIHFAGLKAVGESAEKPLEYYNNNITGTLTLLELMNEYGVRKMVFSSSATVYGVNNIPPFVEDMPLGCINPYGYTKWMIEQILTDLVHAQPNWAVTLLRYFNPIGAHKSGLIGENPKGVPNNLLPYVALVANGKQPYLQVFGDDYDTADGTGVRDYIHVCDLSAGHICALSYLDDHNGIDAFNLGTGKGYSVLEVLRAFEKACGKKIPYKIAPRRAGDIAACYASTEKAEQMLGWRAERGLDDMCRDAWRFASGCCFL